MSRIGDWISERWPVRAVVRWSLEEEITGGASYYYTLGSSLAFVFIVQAVTGIWQMLYYVPTLDHAYASISYFRFQVPLGWLIHGLHYWGSNAFVVLLVLHIGRVFVWGAYKNPRQLTWLIGVVLAGLVMAMTFTGALLPWDELGYWAAEVGTSIAGTVPVIGDFLQRLMRGGAPMGQLALARFYGVHVIIFAALLAAFIGLHLVAFRQFGSVGPWSTEKARRRGLFWPDQLFKDLMVVSVVFLILIGLSAFVPAQISGPADPLDTSYTPKPEWNYLFLYQALKAFSGRWEPVGTVGIPIVLLAILVLLPFYDRRDERSPLRRRFAMGAGFVLAAGLLALTVAGFRSNPEQAAGGRPAPPPGAREGRTLFYTQGCIGCHTMDGQGGHVGPVLSGEGRRGRSRAWITEQIRNPASHYPDSPMPEFTDLSDRQVADLVDLLESRMGPTESGAASAASFTGPGGQPLPASGSQGPPGPAAEMVGSPEHGQIIFSRTCQECHGPGGIGYVPNPGSSDGTVPPLKPIDPGVANGDPAVFASNVDRFIQHGSRPEGESPAVQMPAFGDTSTLSQEQIAQVEAFMLALNGVDRARIVSPGISPRTFFFISLGVFAATWCVLGAWWVALRGKRGTP